MRHLRSTGTRATEMGHAASALLLLQPELLHFLQDEIKINSKANKLITSLGKSLQDKSLRLQALVVSRLDHAITYPLFLCLKDPQFLLPSAMNRLLRQVEDFLACVVQHPAGVCHGSIMFSYEPEDNSSSSSSSSSGVSNDNSSSSSSNSSSSSSSSKVELKRRFKPHPTRVQLAQDALHQHAELARHPTTVAGLAAAAAAMLEVLQKRRAQEEREAGSQHGVEVQQPASNDGTERTHAINDAYVKAAPNASASARSAHAVTMQNHPTRWLLTLPREHAAAAMAVAREQGPVLHKALEDRAAEDAEERVERRQQRVSDAEAKESKRKATEKQQVDKVNSPAYKRTVAEVSREPLVSQTQTRLLTARR
jgi:hypothetical protein